MSICFLQCHDSHAPPCVDDCNTPCLSSSSVCDSELKQRYQITAVPKLVIVKENGEVITDKGRKQIRDKGLACFRTWLESAEIFQNFNSF